MTAERRIFTAFALNLSFAILEFFGGALTGSVAITSDALHDLGDAAGIGLSWFLERKSGRPPDGDHTFGYARFSVLGGILTALILLFGSVFVILNAVQRIFHPVGIHYNGMILFALLGAGVNLGALWFTRDGDSLNQKAVNLHMLEDVLGWLMVLLGAVVMRFTGFALLDPLLSVGVALFILVHAGKPLKEGLDILLESVPHGLSVPELEQHLLQLDGVLEIHHLHLWTLDGRHNLATLHAVTDGDFHAIKHAIREELAEHGVGHVTLELESPGEHCHARDCRLEPLPSHGHHHHHHHHH